MSESPCPCRYTLHRYLNKPMPCERVATSEGIRQPPLTNERVAVSVTVNRFRTTSMPKPERVKRLFRIQVFNIYVLLQLSEFFFCFSHVDFVVLCACVCNQTQFVVYSNLYGRVRVCQSTVHYCIVSFDRLALPTRAMAGKGKGKAGQSPSDWLGDSARRFREGLVRDPMSMTGPGMGVWDNSDDSSGIYVSQAILRPKSSAKGSKSKGYAPTGHERVAVPSTSVPSNDRASKYHKGDSKTSTKGKGKSKDKPKPKQEVVEKSLRQMRYENTTSLTYNPMRWIHMICGRPVVVFHVLQMFRSCVRRPDPQSF